MAARYLVDGNNVMGSRPDGWWRDRAGAARNLVARLDTWAAAADAEVEVVFDGSPPDDPPRADRVAVRYAPRGGRDAADDVIAALVATDGDPSSLRVVTSDAALAARVRAHGAEVLPAGRFRAELEPPDG